MGDIYVTVTVRNPMDRDRSWEGRFLVDTGSMDCLVPRQHLEAIGIGPRDSVEYCLADGSSVEFETTYAEFEFMDEIYGGRAMLGDPEAEPLLGVVALEAARLLVDPLDGQLKRRAILRA